MEAKSTFFKRPYFPTKQIEKVQYIISIDLYSLIYIIINKMQIKNLFNPRNNHQKLEEIKIDRVISRIIFQDDNIFLKYQNIFTRLYYLLKN